MQKTMNKINETIQDIRNINHNDAELIWENLIGDIEHLDYSFEGIKIARNMEETKEILEVMKNDISELVSKITYYIPHVKESELEDKLYDLKYYLEELE